MSYDWKQQIYWRLPVRMQEAALSLYAKRLEKIYYGPGYEEFKAWITEAEAAGPGFIEEWQNERLSQIIARAARHAPYYRERFRGLPWEKVRSKADLHMLPVLEKQSIRRNEGAFVAEGERLGSLWVEKTSGTTGTSLKIYWPLRMVPQFWAIMEVMVRNVAGVAQEIPRAMAGGRPIIPGDTDKPPFWRFNRHWRQLYVSSYHISRKTAPHYVKALRRYDCRWMTGYGSAIAALADNALELGESAIGLRSVIVSGDTLSASMQSRIEAFFRCKCFNHYGQSEGVAMSMECSHGRMHVIPMLGIIEILRTDGTPCSAGEVGEVVATGLLNDAMPLIRYKLGDYAAWAKEQSCGCGNKFPIISDLEGRTDDYLVTSDGRRIGRLSTAMKRSPTIHSAQIVQDRAGHAFLLVRPGSGYRSSHALLVKEDILAKIGNFDIEIREMNEIPRTPQGKTILVVRIDERPSMCRTYEFVLGRKLR